MQWQPTVQAWFCIQIKAFNYTQCFDKMALTSCSVDARMETLRKTRLFIGNFEASKWMCNQRKTRSHTCPTHKENYRFGAGDNTVCDALKRSGVLLLEHGMECLKTVLLRVGARFTSLRMCRGSVYEWKHACGLDAALQWRHTGGD